MSTRTLSNVTAVPPLQALARHPCLDWLEEVREMFAVHGPATLFLANSLRRPARGHGVELFCQYHVGEESLAQSDLWAEHLTRGWSLALRVLRRKVSDIDAVGKIHVYNRGDLLPLSKWRGWKLLGRLLGLQISDQMFGWCQRTEGEVVAVVVRRIDGKEFTPTDRVRFGQAIFALSTDDGLKEFIRRERLEPYLPPRYRSVRDHLVFNLSDKEISTALDLRSNTVKEYVDEVKRRYGVESRGKVMRRFVEHGGDVRLLALTINYVLRWDRPEPYLPPHLQRVRDQLVCNLTDREIASTLGIRLDTAKEYVDEVKRRYGVDSRGDVLWRYIEHGGDVRHLFQPNWRVIGPVRVRVDLNASSSIRRVTDERPSQT